MDGSPDSPYTGPMRIQARPGSPVEQRYIQAAIARGIAPNAGEDLIFRGGKTVPQMEFQDIFLGSAGDWPKGDVDSIDAAIGQAMRHQRLNNVMLQYFRGQTLTCDPRPPIVLGGAKPQRLAEPDVQVTVVALYDDGKIQKSDLATTVFNLVLPPGTVLSLGADTSLDGLGGYHGSVHIQRDGRRVTLYYSANVYSQILTTGQRNGIVAFDQPWKNVVGTLYHELNEFRTDPDVSDDTDGSHQALGWVSASLSECGDQPLTAVTITSLNIVLQEVAATNSTTRVPVQFMYSNAVHGAEGPIAAPHP
jgi:hypothetical protein